MRLSVLDRAFRYAAKYPPAVSGAGGHAHTLGLARALVDGFCLSLPEALDVLKRWNVANDERWSDHELHHKIEAVASTSGPRAPGWLLSPTPRIQNGADGQHFPLSATPAPPEEIVEDCLRRVATGPRLRPSDLISRSPVRPQDAGCGDFLRLAYPREGERVIVFTDTKSQGQAVWPADTIPSFGPDGVWFLIQPVDGEFHPNPRNGNKPSRRSAEAVTSWRFLLLESDCGEAGLWLRTVLELPLPVFSVCSSGGRSYHVLLKVDAEEQHDLAQYAATLAPYLESIGTDTKALRPVQLARLPGCFRNKTDKSQRLFYLNPDPKDEPVLHLPVQR